MGTRYIYTYTHLFIMDKVPFILILLCVTALIVVPASATYNKTFLSTDTVVVNQSYVQDPVPSSTPWTLWVCAGFVGLILIVMALIRPKSQRMDYEVNIILSVLAWPFVWYWAWGGITSIDYVVGTALTATCSDSTVMITQHILYSFWVLGWIGIGGSVFAAFVTALLVSQFNLFKDNESEAVAKQQQRGRIDGAQ